MKEFVEKLKQHLGMIETQTRQTSIGYCTTCFDWVDVETIDVEVLWAEIDAFCESFQKGE